MKKIAIYIDGSCTNNGFKNGLRPYGGWAFIVVHNNEVIYEESQGELFTTNNKMEIESMIQALEYIKKQEYDENTEYEIYSDSEYVIFSTLYWIKKWVVNDWTKVTGDGAIPVKNKELWEKVHQLFYKDLEKYKIKIFKVKAHATDTFNNIVDKLAKNASEKHKNKNLEEYNKGPGE